MQPRSLCINREQGFTLIELLVGLLLFGVVGMSLVSFATGSFRNLGIQNRASSAGNELRHAIDLLATELRMSGSVSPYLVGNTASTVTCSGALAVTSTTVKFLVVNDDASSTTSGVKAYYVGYKYDAAKKELLRGEINKTVLTNCTLPVGDPTSATYAHVIAENVEKIDNDNNGTLDNPFSMASNVLTVHLGIKVEGSGGETSTDNIVTQVFVRTN